LAQVAYILLGSAVGLVGTTLGAMWTHRWQQRQEARLQIFQRILPSIRLKGFDRQERLEEPVRVAVVAGGHVYRESQALWEMYARRSSGVDFDEDEFQHRRYALARYIVDSLDTAATLRTRAPLRHGALNAVAGNPPPERVGARDPGRRADSARRPDHPDAPRLLLAATLVAAVSYVPERDRVASRERMRRWRAANPERAKEQEARVNRAPRVWDPVKGHARNAI
jgi:hypothetical protein